MTNGMKLAAIILTGGRGERLGGVQKALITLNGKRLIDLAIEAAHASGAEEIVVVGDEEILGAGDLAASVLDVGVLDSSVVDGRLLSVSSSGVPVRVVREDPPFGGPLAALDAGLSKIHSERVLLLAGDLPYVREACELLSRHFPGKYEHTEAERIEDGVNLVDSAGIPQRLIGIFRTEALRGSLNALAGEVSGKPLRVAFEGLQIGMIGDPDGFSRDIDTFEDLAAVGAELPEDSRNPSNSIPSSERQLRRLRRL